MRWLAVLSVVSALGCTVENSRYGTTVAEGTGSSGTPEKPASKSDGGGSSSGLGVASSGSGGKSSTGEGWGWPDDEPSGSGTSGAADSTATDRGGPPRRLCCDGCEGDELGRCCSEDREGAGC